MKKKTLVGVLALLFSTLVMFTFSSCDKDTMCYVNINVVDELDNSPVEGAYVKIDNNGSSIFAEGATNANGVYKAEFAAPAIFNVNVQKDVIIDLENGIMGYRKGDATFKLKEGETIDVTVTLKEHTYRY